MLVLLIVKRFKPVTSSAIAQTMVRITFRLLLFLAGAKVEVRGSENIPKDGGVLFVSNHRSYFDILAGYAYTHKPLGFVAKYEMIKVPLLKQWMDLLNCLFLNRKDIKQGLKTILQGVEKVKSGVSIWICPEGTRNLNDDVTNVKDFKEGFHLPKHMAEHIYMFSGPSVRVKLLAPTAMMDELIDWLGKEFKASEIEDKKQILVTLRCNEDSMFYWALQYGPYVEVLEPESLRTRLKKAIFEMNNKYKK